ncbi:MAG: MFS transporter [Chlamydiales bacterium]|nr:MFS transporter [Chlamydiales bacterium]
MGQVIVFPIYSKALFDTHSLLLAATTPEATRNLWYGILVGVFFFCWFLGAALLSDFSDKAGRKKALMICLGGSALGNLLSAFAFTLNNVWILLLGRIIAGFTNGSQPIAQASIVDTFPKDKLSRNLGFIVMSVSLGHLTGPLIGGFLSSPEYVAWFSDSIPFYFAGGMALFNIVLLFIFFHETFAVHEKAKIHLTKAFEIFVSAFKHKSVRYLSICYIFLQTAWAVYYVYISAFMVQEYRLSRTAVALFFSFLSLGLVLGLALLAALFEKRKFERKTVIFGGYSLLLISLLVTAFTDQKIWAWLAAFPLGI